MSIFIIEDDAAVGDALKALLSDAGRKVELLPTAEALLARGAPAADDIIVVDLGLPGMSGADLIRWLKTQPERSTIFAISGRCPCRVPGEQDALKDVPLLHKPPTGDWHRLILGQAGSRGRLADA